MKRICTIHARGGSKGLPNKNKRLLLGIPLIAHSIVHAYKSRLFDYIAVSSDDEEILEIAKSYGVIAIRRPDELATDDSKKLLAISHTLDWFVNNDKFDCHFDTLVDLDATSPLRSVQDIEACVELLESKRVSNVITASPAHRSPEFNMVKLVDGVAMLAIQPKEPISSRQQSNSYYDMNASIYAWNIDKLRAKPQLFYDDTALYKMPRERSVDIDDMLDFQIVELIMKNQLN